MDDKYITIKHGDMFKHYKGKIISVDIISNHTETGENLVTYHDLNDEYCSEWSRPSRMFLDVVEKDGKKVNRFNRLYPYSECADEVNSTPKFNTDDERSIVTHTPDGVSCIAINNYVDKTDGTIYLLCYRVNTYGQQMIIDTQDNFK